MNLTQVAVAERLVIGNVELRNVPFIILSDRQQPFASWGPGKRCILGMQVLLAVRNMTWKGSFPWARLELARPAIPRDIQQSNLCFNGRAPLLAAEYQGQRVMLFVDTGAGKTVLHAAFAGRFPALMVGAPRKRIAFEGVDGETTVDVAVLRALSLGIGGHDAAYRPLSVYLKGHGAADYDGMAANDLAGKARELTFDFEAMRVRLK